MIKIYIGAAAAVLLAGCASTETEQRRLSASEKIGTEVATNEEGEDIICRRTQETGSRVKFTKVCGTQAEWDVMDEENRRALNDLTKNRAASNSS